MGKGAASPRTSSAMPMPSNLGITSAYLQGIDNDETIEPLLYQSDSSRARR
jgi:hypothetical protein